MYEIYVIWEGYKKMIKRKLVILLLIICFVLSLQVAFASNDLNNTDASAYSSIDSNDDLKIDNADSFSQLQDKVNDIQHCMYEIRMTLKDIEQEIKKNEN